MKRLVLLLALLPAPALALDCDNAVSQTEMTGCASQAYEAADADLNAAYKTAMTRAKALDDWLTTPVTATESLRKAQRSWITYRDQACTAEILRYNGGTIANMVYYTCLERLTKQRQHDLEIFAEEG